MPIDLTNRTFFGLFHLLNLDGFGTVIIRSLRCFSRHVTRPHLGSQGLIRHRDFGGRKMPSSPDTHRQLGPTPPCKAPCSAARGWCQAYTPEAKVFHSLDSCGHPSCVGKIRCLCSRVPAHPSLHLGFQHCEPHTRESGPAANGKQKQ